MLHDIGDLILSIAQIPLLRTIVLFLVIAIAYCTFRLFLKSTLYVVILLGNLLGNLTQYFWKGVEELFEPLLKFIYSIIALYNFKDVYSEGRARILASRILKSLIIFLIVANLLGIVGFNRFLSNIASNVKYAMIYSFKDYAESYNTSNVKSNVKSPSHDEDSHERNAIAQSELDYDAQMESEAPPENDNVVGYSYIEGYEREDGTQVDGHYRTDPDDIEENNFGYNGDREEEYKYEEHF